MPAIHSITVPKWGLSMEKGRLTAWHRQVGDRVSPGEEICDIETDKISGGLEVNVGGVLRRKLAQEGDELHVGVSTRGALTLYRAAQGLALVSGRDYVIPDDIKTLAVPVLSHRVVGKSFLQAGEFGAAEAIIRDIVDRLRVPT